MDHIDEMVFLSAESRNVTESDIPGAGRLLGRMYSKLGRKFENCLSSVVCSMKRGTVPTAEKILVLRWRTDPDGTDKATVEKLNKGCRELVKHISYVQLLAYSRWPVTY